MTRPSVFHRAVLLGLLTLAPASALHAEFRLGLAKSVAKRGAKISEEVFPDRPAPMILPVPAAMVTHGEIIWPFGVRGGGHPQGHPGFDFNTDVGARSTSPPGAGSEACRTRWRKASRKK